MENNLTATNPISGTGVVYTETIVHFPPASYANDAPYQLAIVDLANGQRVTVRITGHSVSDRVQIGDSVVFADEKEGVLYFRKRNETDLTEATESSRSLV